MKQVAVAAFTVLSLLCGLARSQFNINSKNNVVVYYGQGPYQQELLHFCQQPTIDVIVLSFVNVFASQGNGLPGTNFGNQCGDEVYPGPGYNGIKSPGQDHLLRNCSRLAQQIPVCQAQYKKKILLSLGGAVGAYGVTGAAEGVQLANLLWGIFGPTAATSTKPGGYSGSFPRPFGAASVDGFDFDVEAPPQDNFAGYIALATQLRRLFAANKSRPFYLSAAPQCPVPDLNLGGVIRAVPFDLILIQFYNTPYCSANAWVQLNSRWAPGAVANEAQFSLSTWVEWLAGGASKNAKVLIGLPGSTAAASASSYVNLAGAAKLLGAHYCMKQFGGVAIWEATAADRNQEVKGRTFYQGIKQSLLGAGQDVRLQRCPAPASTTPQPPAQQPPTGSATGMCGAGKGKCSAGNCCSQFGFCGKTTQHCGTGCQAAYGTCANNNPPAKPAPAKPAPAKPSPSPAKPAPPAKASPKPAPAQANQPKPLPISTNGSCGAGKATCKGVKAGQCCSRYGYCGSSAAYCGAGCQSAYGLCGNVKREEEEVLV